MKAENRMRQENSTRFEETTGRNLVPVVPIAVGAGYQDRPPSPHGITVTITITIIVEEPGRFGGKLYDVSFEIPGAIGEAGNGE